MIKSIDFILPRMFMTLCDATCGLRLALQEVWTAEGPLTACSAAFAFADRSELMRDTKSEFGACFGNHGAR